MSKILILVIIVFMVFAQGDENLLQKGRTSFNNGQLKAAQESLGKIISDFRDSEHLAETYFLLGEIAYQENKLELALRHYDRAAGLDHSEFSARAYFRAAKCYERMEIPQMALFMYLKLINSYPASNQAGASRRFVDELAKLIDN